MISSTALVVTPESSRRSAQLVRIAQQQQDGETHGVGGRLVARDQQDVADPQQLLVAEVAAVLADQHAENVVARMLTMPSNQQLHVRLHLARVPGLCLRRGRAVKHGVTSALELRAV